MPADTYAPAPHGSRAPFRDSWWSEAHDDWQDTALSNAGATWIGVKAFADPFSDSLSAVQRILSRITLDAAASRLLKAITSQTSLLAVPIAAATLDGVGIDQFRAAILATQTRIVSTNYDHLVELVAGRMSSTGVVDPFRPLIERGASDHLTRRLVATATGGRRVGREVFPAFEQDD